MVRMTSASLVPSAYVVISLYFFFFNDTATTEIYTLSLHDALPICRMVSAAQRLGVPSVASVRPTTRPPRSEEHTSELQSPVHLVCRLLLEKKKRKLTNREPSRSSQPPAGTSPSIT